MLSQIFKVKYCLNTVMYIFIAFVTTDLYLQEMNIRAKLQRTHL
jgi:hypothetical protein